MNDDDLIAKGRYDLTENKILYYSRKAENSLRLDENIMFFVYTHDITERILESKMINKLGAMEYDVLGLIDVKSHRSESKSVKGVRSLADSGNRFIQGQFEDVVHSQILKTVHEVESENLEKQLSMEVNKEKLEKYDTYHIAFSAFKSDGSYRRKQIDFHVINRNVNLDCYMRVDPVRLKQIFINLLSNAIKFTPDGGTITAEYECLKREGMIAYDRFKISDTGIGMTRDFLEHGIFQPFSQEHKEVTGQYAGSGLGLSIVKKLVELMGGTIAVESEPGVGTTFTVELAIEKVNQEEIKVQEINATKFQAHLYENLKEKHILLAEDHPLNAEITQKLLSKVGCDTDWVQNGRECIHAFEGSETGYYDAILMDIRMPIMNGLDATTAIRRLTRRDAATIPIIAMTANAYEDDVKKSLEIGMNAHLSKPIEREKMYETIAKLME